MLQQVFNINSSFNICHGAILLCLICYVTTKIVGSPDECNTARLAYTYSSSMSSSLRKRLVISL